MKRLFLAFFLLPVVIIAIIAAGYYLSTRLHGPSTESAPSGPKIEYYTCSMHPYLHEPQPGNCPACGMKLQPVYEKTGDESEDPVGTVQVSTDEERLLGIRTVAAELRVLRQAVRTIGRVEVNEENLQHVHTRFEGWVDQLYVNSVGQEVRRGDALFSIYSPQLVASQEEYLLALKAVEKLADATDPDAAAGARSLLAAVRERLRLLEMPEEMIRSLETSGKIQRTVTLRSHANGFVQSRNVTAGQQVMPGADLYVIADLSDVWITADVYERDFSRIAIGQTVSATFSGIGGRAFLGRVSFIYPYLDEATRTNKIRITLANPHRSLRPGMYGDITIGVEAKDSALVVPADAVLVTGERSIVFKRIGEGKYAPVEVRIGRSTEGYTEILEGLEAGDIVVDRGQFYLDSESQLRLTGAGASPHAGHGTEAAPEASRPAGGADPAPPAAPVASPAAASNPHAGH